ncbi:hypothetical protein ABPG72_008809 [Tetrahymena utriculariae]
MDQGSFRGESDQGSSSQQREQKLQLARRPKLDYEQQSKPLMLLTNYLKIELNKTIEEIYLLRVDFYPRIEADNRVLRDKLLSVSRAQLKECLGGHYLINAQQIFSVEKPNFNKETSVSITFQKTEYQVNLKIAKVFKLDELNSENQRKSQFPLLFFNVMVKNILKGLNFFEFGKNTKYFEPSAEYHSKIEGTNLIVYKGWNTPFENCKDGLLMKLDIQHKVARRENALNYINLIYKNNNDASKEQKRKLVCDKLQGQTLMANYGNFKQFKVHDVIFDKNCKELKVSDPILDPNSKESLLQIEPPTLQQPNPDADLTIYDYYYKKYGLKIKYDKQPLLLVYEKKLKRFLYFVPELCLLTGVPDELNDYQKRELIACTKQKPSELYSMVTQFIDKIVNVNTTEGQLNTQSIAEHLGINFSNHPHVIQAKQIAFPTIVFGGPKKDAPRQTIEDNSASQFSMKYPVYSSGNQLSIALLHFKDFNTTDLFSNWIKIQKELRIEVKKPQEFNLGDFNNKAMQEIEHVIKREIKKEKFDIVAIVAPNKFSTVQNYSKIKKLCTIQQQIKSQYIRQQSLDSKQSYNVCSAILSQMAAKCGTTLWVVNPPNGIPDNTMIIGTSVQKVFINGQSQFVIGFVASQDKNVSRFYSRATFQKFNKDNIEKISTFIVDAIKQYFVQNKFVPENIIYLRENIADNGIQKYLATEIKEVLKSFTVLSPQYKPKLCVVLLESRHGVRVLQQLGEGSNRELANPPSGTIIDSSITSKCHYDFYMISQNVKQGTATPVHYKVIYDTTEFPEGRLQELLYSQCFNYVNWSGSIKYPAQIQYAKKLAKMVGTFIQEEVSEKLFNSRFYI